MFGDLNNFYDDDETLDLLKRYKEMLSQKNHEFFDIYEFESIIDYFSEQYNFDDAIKVVCLAIRQHPNASSMKLRYAQLLIETLKPGKALRILKKLTEAESGNYELYLSMGIALNMTGKSDEAQRLFRKALKFSDENRDEVAYSIAQSFMQYGLYSNAINYLLLSYHYNKDNILVIYDLGLCYEKLRNYPKSLLYYNRYLEIDPFAEHVWNNTGLIYSRSQDFQKAENAFDFALAINPQFIPAYFSKAELFILQRKITKAIETYQDLLLEDCVNTKALCDMAKCFMALSDYPEALRLFKCTIEIAFDCSEAWHGVSLVYLRQRKFGLSISSIKKAIGLEKDNSGYWFILGEIYSRARKFNKAIQAFNRSAELNPANLEALMACAQVLFRKRRIIEAIDLLNLVYDQAPENSQVSYRLAAYHAYLSNITESLRFFRRALSLNYAGHAEMFRHFPKTKSIAAFRFILEKNEVMPDVTIKHSNN